MKREQVAKTIGCTTESLRRWYVEGKKQGVVTKVSKSESKGDDSSVSTKPVGAEAEATSAPHDPGAGLGEHEVKAILDYKRNHPSMGPAQIRAQLKRFLGWRVSVKAIARVLRKAGYAPVHRKGRPVGDEHPRRFEAPYRNAIADPSLEPPWLREASFTAHMAAPSFGPIILGGNVFGWTVSRDDAFTLLDAYVDKGGRAVDTADVYPAWVPGNRGGESEEIIGAWLAARKQRDRVIVSTKVAKWPAFRGLSANNINAAIEGSLRRLQTDYIDVYHAHEDDPAIEQAEYLAAFDALVRAGKVRTLGASNFTAARLASAVELSRSHGLAAFEVSQDHWNLIERRIERELVPLLEREHIVETPFWSLASGFLTGKYRPGVKVDSARSGTGSRHLADPANQQLLADLDAISAAHGASLAAVALAWLRAQRSVGAPIASARTVAQLDPLFERVTLTSDDLARLSRPRSAA